VPSLNEQIIAYLSVNNISYVTGDYKTGQPEGQPDQILYWNTEKLGAEPTQAQIDEAWPIWEGQQIAAQNKAQAESLLQATDWTATVDINNPQYSNPYLGNQSAFLAYRSDVRKIAVNPPVTVDVWPTKPDEVWVTVPAN
jgi:hypothetical protein